MRRLPIRAGRVCPEIPFQLFWAELLTTQVIDVRSVPIQAAPLLTRTALILLLLAGIPGLSCSEQSGTPAPDTPPNLILISLDTLRADRIDYSTPDGGLSPNISRLASRSLVFTDTLSVSPWTLPAHASIFTGLYPLHHGARGGYQAFPPNHRSLTETLSAAGYETVSFNGGANVAWRYGFDRGFDTYRSFRFSHGVGTRQQYLESDAILPMKEGIDWIEKHRDRQPSGSKPFFLFLHTYEVHAPYYSREHDAFTGHDVIRDLQRTRDRAGAARAAADYDGGVRWADHWVGQLLEILEKNQLAENTIVIVTSDHGEGFLEHGFVSHSLKLYQEFLHVPLIIFDPRHPTPRTLTTPASLVDIAPTILSLLGLEPTPGLDGRNLLAEADPDRPRFAEIRYDPGWARQMIEEGIIRREEASSTLLARGPWRLIANDLLGTFELYNLNTDPGALTDLSAVEPEVLANLQAELAGWLETGETTAGDQSDSPEPMDDEQAGQLRALGYIE